MCSRYSSLSKAEIIEIRKIIQDISLRIINDDFTDHVQPTNEIRPTNHAPVIISQGQGAVSFQNLRWGFQKWDGKGVIINARGETLETKDIFAQLLKAGRCVVPAGEYYEWKQAGREKSKHLIKNCKGNLLFMAGLYRDTDKEREFVIITKDAWGDVADIHDRMPVILQADQIEAWLTGKLSPDDIVKVGFNGTVVPCDGMLVQMSFDDLS